MNVKVIFSQKLINFYKLVIFDLKISDILTNKFCNNLVYVAKCVIRKLS